jgi:hypothetical protein
MKLPANWKTTASSILTVLIALLSPVAAIAVLLPADSHIPLWAKIVLSASTGVVSAGKIAIGMIQKDAGEVTAIPAQGGAPVTMPSTEVPLQPGATVVTEDKP